MPWIVCEQPAREKRNADETASVVRPQRGVLRQTNKHRRQHRAVPRQQLSIALPSVPSTDAIADENHGRWHCAKPTAVQQLPQSQNEREINMANGTIIKPDMPIDAWEQSEWHAHWVTSLRGVELLKALDLRRMSGWIVVHSHQAAAEHNLMPGKGVMVTVFLLHNQRTFAQEQIHATSAFVDAERSDIVQQVAAQLDNMIELVRTELSRPSFRQFESFKDRVANLVQGLM